MAALAEQPPPQHARRNPGRRVATFSRAPPGPPVRASGRTAVARTKGRQARAFQVGTPPPHLDRQSLSPTPRGRGSKKRRPAAERGAACGLLQRRPAQLPALPPEQALLLVSADEDSVRLVSRSARMLRLDVTETFGGVSFPGHLHTQESLSAACAFQFRGSDVLLVTYPKSGTTWMQEILTLIFSNGDPEPAKTTPNWARTPWLEHMYFKEILKETGAPRLLTTHLPQEMLAVSLKKVKPKVIHLARNPKDVAVSFYHFHRMANFFPDPGTFDEFLLSFLDGTVHYGSWFAHTKGWLSCQEELGVFCITYEELHQAFDVSVERLGTFLGHPLQPGQVASIREHCSFASMRSNSMVNGTLVPQEILDFRKGQFMRKGTVGDWRTCFSLEQSALFNRKYQQEMGDCCLRFQGLLD